MEHQQKAIDKLSKTKVGALYMDMGTGKTRTALDLAVTRTQDQKADCILWLCPVSVKRTIADEVNKHLPGAIYELVNTSGIKDWNVDIYIAGIESLSASLSLNFVLLELVEKRNCFNSLGSLVAIRVVIIDLSREVFPPPVVPAISRWTLLSDADRSRVSTPR